MADQQCSNVTWAKENGASVEWARSMWACLDACDLCEVTE